MAAPVVKRSEKLDVLKGLAIVYVVLGHSGTPFFSPLTSLFQPMFFFIAGYLYKDIYTQNPWDMVKKRTTSLYLPFIQYGLVFGLLHNFLFSINVYTEDVASMYNRVHYFHTTQEYLVNLVKILSFAKVEQIGAAMWFLPVLFIVNMLFLFISYAVYKLSSPEKKDLWMTLAVFGAFCIGFLFPMQKIFFLRPISISMVVVVTYYFGYLFKKYEARIPVNGFYAAACFMVLVISVKYGPQDTGAHQFIAPPFFLAASVCAFYTSYYAATVLEQTTVLKNFMLLAGKNTIEIMSLHFIAFRLVNYLQVRIYDLPAAMIGSHPTLSKADGWWAVYLVAGLGLPLLAKAFYEKLKGYVRPRQQPVPY